MKANISWVLMSLVLGASLVSGSAASEEWPQREITLVVPYGAGGSTDVFARVLANYLRDKLGKPIVVANKPGAMGTLGPSYVSKQKPDGYTIGIVSDTTLVLAPLLVSTSFFIEDFEYTSEIYAPRFGIAVRADAPYLTMQELVQAAKTDKTMFFGSPGAFNSLVMFNLNATTGSNFAEVAYKSGADVTTAVLGNQIQVTIQNPSDILPHVRSGKMRLLASAGDKRWPQQPDVPTLREMGYAVTADTAAALGMPKGTPKEIVQKLDAVIQSLRQIPEYRAKLDEIGYDVGEGSSADFAIKLRRKAVDWKTAVKNANIAPAK